MKIREIIDLSVTIEPGMATWPTNPEIVLQDIQTFDKDGYKEELYSSSTHTGTHIDAPVHMHPPGKPVDMIELGMVPVRILFRLKKFLSLLYRSMLPQMRELMPAPE